MSALTCASLYSGGGGADLGLVAAGCTPLWAVERDPAVAACYRANLGDHVLVGDVAGLDPAALPRPDLLWVSEPCQQHSLARSRALPARDDGDLSAATGAVVRALRPPLLIAENVPGYRHSAAYRAFIATLHELGYMVDSQLVNCSDYGVPQSRVRLIVRARLGGLLPPLPPPLSRRGWYDAVADLLPDCPPARFTDWQLARLPDTVAGSFICSGTEQRSFRARVAAEPCWTLTKSTITKGRPRAFLVDGQYNGTHTRAGVRVRGLTVRADGAPCFTLTRSTVEQRCKARAWLDTGRVVALTPRCLARLQGFPDWYALPDSRGTVGMVLGNAVPPPLAERLARGLLTAWG